MNVRVTQSGTFLLLSLEASELYVVCKEKLNSTHADIRDDSIWNASIEVSKHLSVAVVFAHAFLESFIFDYGSEFLGSDYFINYLDKLDTLSKYIVVPELISEKEVNQTSGAINRLREIVKYRNALIHSKSFMGNNMKRARLEKVINTHHAQDRVIRQMPKSLLTILTELYSLHPCDTTAFYMQKIEMRNQKKTPH